MQTEEPKTGASILERRIDVSVPLTDIDKAVDQRLKNLARTVKMSGFRVGKVPLKIVAQQYGPQVRSEAIGDAVQQAFGDAVRQQNLRVAGFPRIEPRQGGPETELEFSAVFEVYPEIQLADISAKEVVRPMLEVGDAEVDKTIEVLRKQRTYFVPAQGAAKSGDRVTVDFTGRINGEVFPGGQASEYPVVLGSGSMLADFETQLVGASAGDAKQFDLPFPADYHAKELAGKTAQFEVQVKRVEEARLPELDAEFGKALGVADGDLVRMRDEIKANVEREIRKRVRARVKEQVMNVLLEAHPIEVPKSLVDEEAQQMAESAKRDLEGRGVNPKDLDVSASWFGDQAMRRVKLGLILAEVVKVNALHAKPEQVRAMIDEFAQSYEDPSEVVRWYYSQRQQMAQVEALVIEENVVDWVLATVKAVEAPTSFDEIMGAAA